MRGRVVVVVVVVVRWGWPWGGGEIVGHQLVSV
jgi:hypothetical protein